MTQTDILGRRILGLGAWLCIALVCIVTRSFGADPATEQQARGNTAYLKNCTNGCHLPDLHAGPIAPALAGDAFLKHWQGLGVIELFDRVRDTMPQQKPRSLNDQTYVDIVAFLLQANGVPPSSPELQSDPDTLASITIQGPK